MKALNLFIILLMVTAVVAYTENEVRYGWTYKQGIWYPPGQINDNNKFVSDTDGKYRWDLTQTYPTGLYEIFNPQTGETVEYQYTPQTSDYDPVYLNKYDENGGKTVLNPDNTVGFYTKVSTFEHTTGIPPAAPEPEPEPIPISEEQEESIPETQPASQPTPAQPTPTSPTYPQGWTSVGNNMIIDGETYQKSADGKSYERSITTTDTRTSTERVYLNNDGTYTREISTQEYKKSGDNKFQTGASSQTKSYSYDGKLTRSSQSEATFQKKKDKDGKTIYLLTGAVVTQSNYNAAGEPTTTVGITTAGSTKIVVRSETGYSVVDTTTGQSQPLTIDAAQKILEQEGLTKGGLTPAESKAQAEEKIKEAEVRNFNEHGWKSGGACGKGFGSCASALFKAYEQYTGWAKLTTLLWSDYGAWAEKNKQTIQKALCDTMLIPSRNCITSKICAFTMPIQADNTLVGVGPSGEPTASATITAERTPPVIINGLTGGQLSDILNSNTIVVDGTAYSTDNAPQPLTLWRYKVHYSITNILDKDLAFNVVFKGPDRTASYYPNDKTLPQRRGTRGDISKYSATQYDKVCLTLNPGIPTHNRQTATTNIMPFGSYAPTLTKELCQPITEYQAVPVSITQETLEEQKEEYIAPPSTETETSTETEETTTRPIEGGNI